MDKFTTLTGVAAPLPIDNIDTDMIIPKQYLKTIKRTGLGAGLFSEMRYREDGSENPDFVLNKPAYRKAAIIVAGDNFGCGSSREHAPWALTDFGVRCVIATDFADIFYNNCFKNGLLPIKVSREDLAKLHDDAERGANATLTIDLEAQEIRGPDGGVVRFEIDPFRKHCLIEGLDDIGLTLVEASAIEAHEKKSAAAHPGGEGRAASRLVDATAGRVRRGHRPRLQSLASRLRLGGGRALSGAAAFGFSWARAFCFGNPRFQGLEKLGFPWILSSEMSLFNGLRAIFAKKNSRSPSPAFEGGRRDGRARSRPYGRAELFMG